MNRFAYILTVISTNAALGLCPHLVHATPATPADHALKKVLKTVCHDHQELTVDASGPVAQSWGRYIPTGEIYAPYLDSKNGEHRFFYTTFRQKTSCLKLKKERGDSLSRCSAMHVVFTMHPSGYHVTIHQDDRGYQAINCKDVKHYPLP
jgi:hypothetical protein